MFTLIIVVIINAFLPGYRWGMSHGFFVIMGGFALYDGDVFCGYLWDRDKEYDDMSVKVFKK